MMALIVKDAGPFATVQDLGRFGWQRFGVSNAGAMDVVALRVANALVGNEPGAAAIEFTLVGGTYEVEGGTCRIAVAGADVPVSIDGRPVDRWSAHDLAPGQTLRIGPARSGARGYLAVAGGLDLPPQLGSRSTHIRSGLGGLEGRALRAGDRLPLVREFAPPTPALALDPAAVPVQKGPARVVLGPQDDHFTPAGIATLLGNAYTVTDEADRMGYRLSGPAVEHAGDFNIISDGIANGSIQVPGTGQPIVLLADRQSTGGYPKIATVITPDLTILAQLRPGDTIRFAAIGIEEAQAVRRDWEDRLDRLADALFPALGGMDSERLLALNLVGGVVDMAAEPE